MRLLILGGTVFLGRHLVDAACQAGHQVTVFNRGRHDPDHVPDVEQLRGDRDGQLDALVGREWDAVVDTSGYVPRVVRQSADLLAGNVGQYAFVSSLSVYPDVTTPGLDESAPVATMPDETVEEITGETYGPLKALCEREVERAFPGRALIARPGLIVGRYDPSDRFTYWPHRVAQGGEVLAPGREDRAIQLIDVRDLAAWVVRMVECGGTGIYNANGPDYRLTMGRLLDVCKAVSGSDARFVWVEDAWLLENGVTPWTELPLWVPEEEFPGFFTFNCGKAMKAGLSFRPLEDTVRDTLTWDETLPGERTWQAGLARDREEELLALRSD